MITEELLEILKDGFAIRTIKKRKDLIDEVLYLTSSCDVSVTLAERIWLVKNGMDIPPVCIFKHAAPAGFEPTTRPLGAAGSTVELWGRGGVRRRSTRR